ncbi:MAG: hypothetical protein V2A70_05930 [Candidatus Omnitrophota bacterium]
MNLLLDFDQDVFQYCLHDGGCAVKEGVERKLEQLKKKVCQLRQDHKITAVVYRISDGGIGIEKSVVARTDLLAGYVGDSPCFGLPHDAAMKEVMHFLQERLADSRHYIVCDSAFFISLPKFAGAYAIPVEYMNDGLVKYGRNGLVHESALKNLLALKGVIPARVITVFLNDSTDVVALRDGVPVMSSHGFSELDGIMSRTGCGNIDTSIVFQLFADGYSSESIYQVLSRESGFQALLGEKAGLQQLLAREDVPARQARDIFAYQLLKMIGAAAAALEGVDTVVFIGNDAHEIRHWVYDFLREFEFLGLKPKEAGGVGGELLTQEGLAVEAYYFKYDKWLLMSDLAVEQVSLSALS